MICKNEGARGRKDEGETGRQGDWASGGRERRETGRGKRGRVKGETNKLRVEKN
jgi:hypothetical protein